MGDLFQFNHKFYSIWHYHFKTVFIYKWKVCFSYNFLLMTLLLYFQCLLWNCVACCEEDCCILSFYHLVINFLTNGSELFLHWTDTHSTLQGHKGGGTWPVSSLSSQASGVQAVMSSGRGVHSSGEGGTWAKDAMCLPGNQYGESILVDGTGWGGREAYI